MFQAEVLTDALFLGLGVPQMGTHMEPASSALTGNFRARGDLTTANDHPSGELLLVTDVCLLSLILLH